MLGFNNGYLKVIMMRYKKTTQLHDVPRLCQMRISGVKYIPVLHEYYLRGDNYGLVPVTNIFRDDNGQFWTIALFTKMPEKLSCEPLIAFSNGVSYIVRSALIIDSAISLAPNVLLIKLTAEQVRALKKCDVTPLLKINPKFKLLKPEVTIVINDRVLILMDQYDFSAKIYECRVEEVYCDAASVASELYDKIANNLSVKNKGELSKFVIKRWLDAGSFVRRIFERSDEVILNLCDSRSCLKLGSIVIFSKSDRVKIVPLFVAIPEGLEEYLEFLDLYA